VSRIVPHLDEGAGVVTSRGDVHYVVTEYGVAYLHGKTIRERARAYLSRAMDEVGVQALRKLHAAERDPVARAELDRLLSAHRPEPRVFREFVPREVRLY